MGVLSVRLEKDIETMLDALMEKKAIQDKSAYIRTLLRSSLQDELVDELCRDVELGNKSVWNAAAYLKMPLTVFLEELGKRDIVMNNDLEADLDFADVK